MSARSKPFAITARTIAGTMTGGVWMEGYEMALFSNEPDNSKSRETVKPVTPPAPLAAVQPAPPVRDQETPLPVRTPGAGAQVKDAGTYLDQGSKISGKLFFEGALRIDGEVDGEISANDAVIIGETAVVTGQLKAASVVIMGKVNGELSGAKRVEIRSSARVVCNLTSPTLVVDDGALFEGHCTMSPEAKEAHQATPRAPEGDRAIHQAVANGDKPA
jgi:cytoskeletal protein CcmA (bactofilin family)